MNEEMINTNESTNSTNEGVEQKTYTYDEVQALLQKNGDQRVSQALKKAQKDFDKKLSLSRLDETERVAKEKEIRIQELESQLAQYEIEKNRSELKSVLSSRGLSAEFADLISVTDDIEESQAKIDALDRLFKSAVANEVRVRLANNKPSVGNGSIDELNKENFQKLSLSERNKLYKEKPDLYNKLTGR